MFFSAFSQRYICNSFFHSFYFVSMSSLLFDRKFYTICITSSEWCMTTFWENKRKWEWEKKISPDFLMNKNHEELSRFHTLFQVSNHVEQFNCILRELYISYFKLILLMRYALIDFFFLFFISLSPQVTQTWEEFHHRITKSQNGWGGKAPLEIV